MQSIESSATRSSRPSSNVSHGIERKMVLLTQMYLEVAARAETVLERWGVHGLLGCYSSVFK